MTSDTDSPGNARHVSAQVTAAWAAFDRVSREATLQLSLDSQDVAFASALREMEAVRRFVGSPQHILGSDKTKHGEIAEHVHVGVARAFEVLNGRAPSATFDGISRLDAVDYRVGGVDIQSKYINGLRNTLRHVSKHADAYPDFASKGIYHIPRDQFEQLQELLKTGRVDGLSDASTNSLHQGLKDLQEATGRPAEDLLRPGNARYAEVQQGRVHETLQNREHQLELDDKSMREDILKEHGPKLGGAAKAATLGAVSAAGVSIGQALWVKWRGGKNPFKGEFSEQDWKDVGLFVGEGALGGGLSGITLYLITNSTDLAAPFAGALVSGLAGVGSLLQQYAARMINAEQFVEMSQIVATDTAIVALAAVAGQTVIPVPVVGTLIGSLAGRFVSSSLQQAFDGAETELLRYLSQYDDWALNNLDVESAACRSQLEAFFTDLESLGSIAFDERVNISLRLEASARLAERAGVPEDSILRSASALDSFMREAT